MPRAAWGVDVATTGIKFVRLSVEPGGGSGLADCAFFPIEGADFGPEWAPRLKAFLASRKIKVTGAVVALSGRDMVIDITNLPRAGAERLAKMVDMHVTGYGEKSEETLSYDWSLLNLPTGARDELVCLLGMAKDPYLDGVLAGLEKAGVGVASFAPSPIALYCAHTKFGKLGDGVTYLADIGEKSLSLAILREGQLLFARNVQSGLEIFIEPLMGALEVKRARAVRFLAEEGKVGATEEEETLEFKAGRTIQSSAEQLAQMLSSSIKFCQVKTRMPKLDPARYVLSGGGRGSAAWRSSSAARPRSPSSSWTPATPCPPRRSRRRPPRPGRTG